MDETVPAFDPTNHQSNAHFRGTKADIYEGGHRVPFLLRWPQVVAPSLTIREPICLTDFFATVLDILNNDNQKRTHIEDSFSFLPLLTGTREYQREPIIHHSHNGMFAIRKDEWKLILGNGSGGRLAPIGKPFREPYQLFNLYEDETESIDVSEDNQEVIKDLLEDFNTIHGRTEALVDHQY